jgi:hypothetical protein
MTPPWGERRGVSGSTPVRPDQDGDCDSPAGESAIRQSCPSAAPRRRFTVECRLRLRLPAVVAHEWMALRPTLRGRVFTAALCAATEGVDLQRLLAAEQELHRVGVNLNQALALAHRHGTPPQADRINAALDLIEALRGGRA